MEDICKLQSELTKCKVTFTSHESDLTLKNEVLNGQIETLTTELEESKCELAQINKQHERVLKLCQMSSMHCLFRLFMHAETDLYSISCNVKRFSESLRASDNISICIFLSSHKTLNSLTCFHFEELRQKLENEKLALLSQFETEKETLVQSTDQLQHEMDMKQNELEELRQTRQNDQQNFISQVEAAEVEKANLSSHLLSSSSVVRASI
jgi:hypothetical protein